MFTLNQDDILDPTTSRQYPQVLEARRQQFRSFIHNAGSCVKVTVDCLTHELRLPQGSLASRCSTTQPSATSLRLFLSEPSSETQKITLGGHTDIGLITFLFHILGGLQILPADADNTFESWRYVKPQADCAVVNLGDILVEWTGGLVRSSLHRVAVAPGEQASVPRQSLAYLVRPARGTTMERLRGPHSLVPRLLEGEEGDRRLVSEWAAERAAQITKGEQRPRTIGGLGARGR